MTPHRPLRAVLLGVGPWGLNLLRAVALSPGVELAAIVDPDPDALGLARARLGALLGAAGARFAPRFEAQVALDLGLDAAIVATPPKSHASLALQCMGAGLDVFVEKPLAMSPEAAARCRDAARASKRVGMVGHILRHHPVAVRMGELAKAGALGQLRRLHASRKSLPGRASAGSPLWNLGPHDLSVLRSVDASPFVEVSAHRVRGGAIVLEARLASGLEARITVCSESAEKERRVELVGDAATAIFDDVRFPSRLVLVDGARDPLASEGADAGPLESARELHVASREPLQIEVDHFFHCVRTREVPRGSFDEGVAVVEVLARASALLEGGAREGAVAAAGLGAAH